VGKGAKKSKKNDFFRHFYNAKFVGICYDKDKSLLQRGMTDLQQFLS